MADGSERPLGIPTFEDKVAQRAIVMVLEPTLDRSRINEIGEPRCRLFLDAFEASGGTIPLKRSHIAGEPGFVEEARHLFECKGTSAWALPSISPGSRSFPW